eukprot:sb/3469327/
MARRNNNSDMTNSDSRRSDKTASDNTASDESLNNDSDTADTNRTTRSVINPLGQHSLGDEPTSAGEVRISVVEEEREYLCEGCGKVFQTSTVDSRCTRQPTSCCTYPNPTRWPCLRGFRGCWYHMTHDELPHDEYPETDMELLQGKPPDAMTLKLWIKFFFISICCLPCVCTWLPLYLCSRLCGCLKSLCGCQSPEHVLKKVRRPTGSTSGTAGGRGASNTDLLYVNRTVPRS